jgi:hypothetical protein
MDRCAVTVRSQTEASPLLQGQAIRPDHSRRGKHHLGTVVGATPTDLATASQASAALPRKETPFQDSRPRRSRLPYFRNRSRCHTDGPYDNIASLPRQLSLVLLSGTIGSPQRQAPRGQTNGHWFYSRNCARPRRAHECLWVYGVEPVVLHRARPLIRGTVTSAALP